MRMVHLFAYIPFYSKKKVLKALMLKNPRINPFTLKIILYKNRLRNAQTNIIMIFL